ncbi:MAG: type II toxin-antitoxin system VapC family toxin [Hyphomicrobiales bacterium]
MNRGERIFVDTSFWIALAVARDPLHSRARDQWSSLRRAGVKLHTSVPIIVETFTFLDRNANRDVALTWKQSVYKPGIVTISVCELDDLERSWRYFQRRDLYRLSAVDATSFAIMERLRIRTACTFDHHFVVAGFKLPD